MNEFSRVAYIEGDQLAVALGVAVLRQREFAALLAHQLEAVSLPLVTGDESTDGRPTNKPEE